MITGILGFVVTSALFLAVSLVDMISLGTHKKDELASADLAKPPPPPPEEIILPSDKKITEETLELSKPRPKMVFDQPDTGLNPGTGGVTLSADLSFDFALEETEMVFEWGEVDKDPRAIAQISPNYPHTLRKTGIDGQVDLEFIVNSSGRVESVKVIRGDGVEFIKEAIIAVKKWKFKPGIKDGEKVSVRMRIPIVFVLNKQRK